MDGLIGRNREFNHIEHLLWSARHGETRALSMRGEPGVGKTALLHAAMARAGDFHVVQLRGLGDGSLTSAEARGPLGDLLRRCHPDQRAGSPAPGAFSTTSEDLVGAAADALQAFAQSTRRPLLLTVDDAHLLPPSFSAALARAVTEGQVNAPLALLIAWRDMPLVKSFELGVAALPEHHLGPIDFDGAEVLLNQLGVANPAPSVLKQLVRATGGNPFALLESCSNLSPDARRGMRELPMPVPVGNAVASSFGGCLEPFDEECREVIGAAATGTPLPILSVALDSLGLDADHLATAQAAGVITIRHHRVDFRHPLVRAAAFQLLAEEGRDEIHLAIAAAYAARGYVERSAFHASQIHHRPDDQVTLLSSHAATVALDRGERTKAAIYNEVAAEFAESEEEAAVHLGQAAAQWLSAGHTERVTECLDRADRLIQISKVSRAELDYERARADFTEAGDLRTTERMVRAAELCAAEAPSRAVLMLVDAAACRLVLSHPEGTVELAERAVQLSRGVSSHTEVLAETTLTVAELFEDRGSSGAGKRPQAIAILLGQAQGFPGSPYLAQLIGEGLMLDGYWTLAGRWANWIERCAATTGDRALSVVPHLLTATTALERGRPQDARTHAEEASQLALAHGDAQMSAAALSLLTAAFASEGNYQAGFESAARLFSLQGHSGRGARIRSAMALATLELERGRRAAAVAWLRTALEEARSHAPGGADRCDTVCMTCLPAIAEGFLLTRREDELHHVVELISASSVAGRSLPVLCEWTCALADEDLDAAAVVFERTRRAMQTSPMLLARVELAWGVRLLTRGHVDHARAMVSAAQQGFRIQQAAGWELVADQELSALDQPLESSSGPSTALAGVEGLRPRLTVVAEEPRTQPPTAAWELQLLGGFSVRRDGEPVQLPLGLAAQGLKVVALRQRILAEELVELLWAEAAPGVGMRRLRNVLWRVRAACGDLLQRDGNFIALADGAEVDADGFRHAASMALDRETPVEKATQLAREALRLYCGELLPGDRYADWAAGPRESLARIQVQLLEFLLSEAIESDDTAEAVVLLNRLIDADPYEEHYRLQLAELHAGGGNRTRALSVLEHAEQMLDELGLPASPALRRIRSSLNGDSRTEGALRAQ